jgi:hypothetical protein
LAIRPEPFYLILDDSTMQKNTANESGNRDDVSLFFNTEEEGELMQEDIGNRQICKDIVSEKLQDLLAPEVVGLRASNSIEQEE